MIGGAAATGLVSACALAGAVVGLVAPPPEEGVSKAEIQVVARHPELFDALDLDGGSVRKADKDAKGGPLERDLQKARRDVIDLERKANRAVRDRADYIRGSPAGRDALREIQEAGWTYVLLYSIVGSDEGSPRLADAVRGALPGLLLGLLLVGGGAALRPARPDRRGLISAAAVAAGLVAALVAAAAGTDGAFAALLIVLLAASALVFALGGDRRIRLLLAGIIVVSPLRGGLLKLAELADVPDPLLVVNSIQPCLAVAAATALALTGQLSRLFVRGPLRTGFALITLVAVLNFATESVGLRIYAIGFGQYLTYPLFALVAWAVLDNSATRWLPHMLAAMATVVAGSVLLHAAGFDGFVQAAPAEVRGQHARYGGITGSFLHASIFLGTAVPLMLGLVLDLGRTKAGLVTGGALVLVLAGLVVTYGRAGLLIAAAGSVILALASPASDRRLVVAAAAAVCVLMIPFALAAGVTPGDIGSRATSAFDSDEAGNEERFKAMERTLRGFRDGSLPEQVLGQGLAATGNARKLAGRDPDAAESVFLKLLVEVGVIGLLLIGGYVIWAGVAFAKGARAARDDPILRGVGAAGVALTLDAVIFPTLEAQLIAMTWWALLVVTVRARAPAGAEARA